MTIFPDRSTSVGELDAFAIEKMASLLAEAREHGGRLFILGIGGSAGKTSDAVNDFRKLVRAGKLRTHGRSVRTYGPHQRRRLADGL